MVRQAPGPVLPRNNQASEARRKPTPSPHCMNSAPLPRAWFGQSSAIIAVPVAHSDPMAMPTRKRKAAKVAQSCARALKPVITE